MRFFTSYLKNSDGAAAAEMALITPLLMVLMFGTFETGHYFWNEHKVVKAVRDGSRFAARQPFTKYSCGTATPADTVLVTQIKNLTRTGTIDGTGNIRVRGWTNAQVTVAISCPATALTTGIYNGMANAPRVQVSAVIPYPSLFAALGFSSPNLNLRAEAQSPVVGI
jgi:Flp pilus assembly protein TadG